MEHKRVQTTSARMHDDPWHSQVPCRDGCKQRPSAWGGAHHHVRNMHVRLAVFLRPLAAICAQPVQNRVLPTVAANAIRLRAAGACVCGSEANVRAAHIFLPV